MATQTAIFFYPQIGVNDLTIDAYQPDGDTHIQGPVDATDLGTGYYTAPITSAGQVLAKIVIKRNGAEVGYGYCDFQGTTGTYEVLPAPPGGSSGGSGTIVVQNNIVISPDVARELTEPNVICEIRGDTLNYQLTLGTITGWTKILFTAKEDLVAQDDDSTANIQVEIKAAGGGGLLVVNGTPALDADLASLSVDDPSLGTVDLYISEIVTAQMPEKMFCDCQWFWDSGDKTPFKGRLLFPLDVTRTTDND